MNPGHEHSPDADIGCLEAIEQLYAWLDGEMTDPAAVVRLEQHLRHCHSCWSRSRLERALTEHIRDAARSEAPHEQPSRSPASLKHRLRKLLNEF